MKRTIALAAAAPALFCCSSAEPPPAAETPSSPHILTYEGSAGPGRGKHVVLVSGDEEYRSEEALPQLAKILANHHGFRCTVLFAVDPETGIVNPHVNTNIPGTEALDSADLMVILTRWRVLPDDQMAPIDRFLQAGKPVIGLRTATHAFAPPKDIHPAVSAYLRQYRKAENPDSVPLPDIPEAAWGAYGHYGDGYTGPQSAWRDGFGRLVVGERWYAHHGRHKHEATKGVIAPEAAEHPILRGVGYIWGPSDVYTVRLPLPGDSTPLVYGQVVARKGEYDEGDAMYGMRPDDGPPVAEKNNPMMPVAWTKSYRLPEGRQGRVFATTMGASTDILSDGVRRMIVNGVYWALGMEERIPEDGTDATIVGDYNPTRYNNHPPEYWIDRAVKPAHFK